MVDGTNPDERRNGIQAVEISGLVLEALCTGRQPMQLKEVAALAGMAPAKVHRYLTSLVRTGMAEQDPRTGLYGLGPNAIKIGLAAIERNDIINRAGNLLAETCLDLQTTGHLAIWNERGPVIIRTEHGGPPVISTMGLGTTMPLLRSATGRAFLAFLPLQATERILGAEMQTLGLSMDEVLHLRETIRARGYGDIFEELVPGIYAISCPVFGIDGNIQCSLTFVSTDAEFFTEDSDAVRHATAAVSSLNDKYGKAAPTSLPYGSLS